MRTLIAACVAIGALTCMAVPAAQADIRFVVPGVHVDIGPHRHYWHHGYWHSGYWHRDYWHSRYCYYHYCR